MQGKLIYKYPLDLGIPEERYPIFTEQNARFLSLGVVNGKVVAYFAVDPDDNDRSKKWVFYATWTGHECPVSNFLGTFEEKDGLVWHIFGG